MGILVTAGAIGVMCVSGLVVTTVFSWFNNLEIELPKKKKDKKDPEDTSYRGRLSEYKNRTNTSEF